MPVKIKIGEVYEANIVRAGESAKGAWEMVVVKSKTKDKKEIAIFSDKVPSGVTEGGTFRVEAITQVNYTSRRREYEGVAKWENNLNIEAKIVPVMSYTDAMADLDSSFDGTPFSELKDPYGDVDNPFAADDDDKLPF